MTKIEIEPWEPEETIGKLWHELASRLDAPSTHDGARVNLTQVGGRLAVLFRGLGGNPATEIKAVAEEKSHHRLSFLRSLGTDVERIPRTSFDGESLRLPESLAVFPAREANAALYLWLTACAAHADTAMIPEAADPMRADIAALAAAEHMVRNTLLHAPGFAGLYQTFAKPLWHCVPARSFLGLNPRSRRISATPWAMIAPCPTCPPKPRAAINRFAPWPCGPTCAT